MAVSLFLYESNIVPLQVELGGKTKGEHMMKKDPVS